MCKQQNKIQSDREQSTKRQKEDTTIRLSHRKMMNTIIWKLMTIYVRNQNIFKC